MPDDEATNDGREPREGADDLDASMESDELFLQLLAGMKDESAKQAVEEHHRQALREEQRSEEAANKAVERAEELKREVLKR